VTPASRAGAMRRAKAKPPTHGPANSAAAILQVYVILQSNKVLVAQLFLDPKTQAWLKNSIEPTFGFPRLVRFSWATVKILLEKNAHGVKWSDSLTDTLLYIS
jgi:hypothetical protein